MAEQRDDATTPAGDDPYWSRRGTDWELAERDDPIRWGQFPGPLSAAQIASYVARGYVIQDGVLRPDEVEQLIADSHRLARELDPTTREDVITEPESGAIRSIFRVHRGRERFRQLVADERLAGVARQLLGGDVYVHQSRINFKPGFDGREFYWHSDFETWHVEDGMPRMRALSVAILLTDNTPINGPLMLVPGSHRAYVRCVGETPPDHYKQSLRAQRYGVPARDALRLLIEGGGIVQATGPAGTVVFFDCNTMHGSTGNLSPRPRHNIFLVYNSVDNRLVAPYGGRPPRPAFLGEREAVGL